MINLCRTRHEKLSESLIFNKARVLRIGHLNEFVDFRLWHVVAVISEQIAHILARDITILIVIEVVESLNEVLNSSGSLISRSTHCSAQVHTQQPTKNNKKKKEKKKSKNLKASLYIYDKSKKKKKKKRKKESIITNGMNG